MGRQRTLRVTSVMQPAITLKRQWMQAAIYRGGTKAVAATVRDQPLGSLLIAGAVRLRAGLDVESAAATPQPARLLL
jgi:hypothetical protein